MQIMDSLTTGTVLGLSAGFAPGPLLTLVISETLRHDIKAGVRVALSPIVTDLPIILLALFILAQLSEFQSLLGLLSLVGGGVVLYMGYETMFPKKTVSSVSEAEPKSLMKGIVVNALSPHPYLFWLSVGGPIMNRAAGEGGASLSGFVASFYLCLIGSKVLLAMLVGRSKHFLTSAMYTYTTRFLGLALCVLAVLLFREGLILLGVMELS